MNRKIVYTRIFSKFVERSFSFYALSIFFCAFMVSLPAHADVPDDEADVYMLLSEEADKAIAEGDYKSAAQRINEALDYDPENPSNVMLLSNLGIVYNYLDCDSLALDAFDRAISIAPSMTVVYENRARLLLKIGDSDRAYSDFQVVIDRDPENLEALFYHGIIALDNGDRLQAEFDFKSMEKSAPDDILTNIALGEFYATGDANLQALHYFRKAVELEPTPDNYIALIKCCIDSDSLTEGAVVASEALGAYPDDAELYYWRARLNKARYLLKEAREDAKTAVRLGADPRMVARIFDK